MPYPLFNIQVAATRIRSHSCNGHCDFTLPPAMLCSRTRNATYFKLFTYSKDTSCSCQKSYAKINSARPFSNLRRLASRTRRPAQVISYDNPAGILAKKRTPTLLYKSGSNLPYILGCYFIGGGLLGCAIVNNHTKNLAVATNVPAYVPLATAIGVFGMVAVGSWMCLRVSRRSST